MREDDVVYFRRRLESSLAQAEKAETASARNAHETLARLYREKLAELGGGAPGGGEPDVGKEPERI